MCRTRPVPWPPRQSVHSPAKGRARYKLTLTGPAARREKSRMWSTYQNTQAEGNRQRGSFNLPIAAFQPLIPFLNCPRLGWTLPPTVRFTTRFPAVINRQGASTHAHAVDPPVMLTNCKDHGAMVDGDGEHSSCRELTRVHIPGTGKEDAELVPGCPQNHSKEKHKRG